MSDATGTTTVVVETPDGAPVPVTVDNLTGQVLTPEAVTESPPPEPGESDAVAIERIRAETEITTAAIRAETESERIAADAQQSEDVAWLRAELANLQGQNSQLRDQLAALSTPPPSVEVEAETVTIDPATETTPTNETQTETSSSIETEASGESVAEKAVEALEEIAATPSPVLPSRPRARMI